MKSFQRQKGFSFIETIVAIAIFTFAMGAVSAFIFSLYSSYRYNLEQTTAINEARRGIETMIKEIRETKTADDGSYPLVEAGDFSFIFYGDIDRDEAVERVRYFLDGTNFKKGIVEPSDDPPRYILTNETISILSQYVRNATISVFTYYNGDWPTDIVNNPLPTLTRLMETKLMHVYLKINVDPSRPPSDFELESDVQIRNLKINL